MARNTQFAVIAFGFLVPAINISCHAKAQLKIIFLRLFFFIMINHQAQILHVPLWISFISLNGVLHGTWDLSFFFEKRNQLFLHDRLFVSEAYYVRRFMHSERQIY